MFNSRFVFVWILQSGRMRKRIERSTDVVIEDKQVAKSVEEEDVILVAQETAPPFDSSSLNPSAIIFEALKFYCRIYDYTFQEIAELPETNGVS